MNELTVQEPVQFPKRLRNFYFFHVPGTAAMVIEYINYLLSLPTGEYRPIFFSFSFTHIYPEIFILLLLSAILGIIWNVLAMFWIVKLMIKKIRIKVSNIVVFCLTFLLYSLTIVLMILHKI